MSLRKPRMAPVVPFRGGGPKDTDPYAVLSMHQPWASLLVYGIKRIEGRGWPTQHRGRLWIHATSQQPTDADSQELEAFYTEVHAREARLPIFPQAYPTSCLLGCVDIIDCLPAEDVEAWPGLPAGLKMEVGSPFTWLCQAPRRLVVPQRMPGAPKIWTLPRAKLDPLAKGLKEPPGLIPFSWAAMPPRGGPAGGNGGGGSSSADSQLPAKQHHQQRQQPAFDTAADVSQQDGAAPPSARVAAARSPPDDSGGAVAKGREDAGDGQPEQSRNGSEPPAKRMHTWAAVAAKR